MEDCIVAIFVSHKLVDKSLNCILLISTIKTKGLDSDSNGQNIVQAGISAWAKIFFARLKREVKRV